MIMLLSVIYIVWFTHHSLVRFAPCFLAVSGDMPCTDARVSRARRVSLLYIVGVFVYAAAWAIVFAEILEGLYV